MKLPILIISIVFVLILSGMQLIKLNVFGTPLSDSKEMTQKVYNLLHNGQSFDDGNIIFTGGCDECPYIGRGSEFILTGYYIENTGTLWRWSDAQKLIEKWQDSVKSKPYLK